MTQRNSGRSFFATLPGMFTGLASLIGAVSALYVALDRNRGSQAEATRLSSEIIETNDTSDQMQGVGIKQPEALEGSNQRAQPARDTKRDPRKLAASEPDVDPRRRVVDATDVKRASPVPDGIQGAWRFTEEWDHETSLCDVGGVYEFEQKGSEFGGQYSQESDCAGNAFGFVTDGEILGYDVSFVVLADEVICVYEGTVSGWPAHRIDGTAVCGDGVNYVTGQWSAWRDMGR